MGNCSTTTAHETSAAYVASATTNAPHLVELLGDTLVSASGSIPTETLGGRAIGLYFSAHWCPPCRGFTPVLTKAYKSLKEQGLEIIFVSSDQSEAAFKSYFKEMPWLALPYGARDVKAKLSQKYGVSGIPTLVILDSSGRTITTDGRSKVMSDPSGQWVPRPPSASQPADVKAAEAKAAEAKAAAASASRSGGLAAVLGSEPLLHVDGKTPVTLAQVAKDAPLVALYFSAHWCPPCRAFTPKLTAFVEKLEASGVHLPVIFGSSDRDADSFGEYFGTMSWSAFPFGDTRVDALKSRFEVSGIPWLVVLDANGNLVANEADEDVPMGVAAYQKWLKRAKAKEPEAAPAA